MKKTILIFVVSLMVFSCSQRDEKKILTIVNPSDLPRTDEAVVVTRDKLASVVTMNSVGLVPILKNSKGIDIPSQLDDLDKDGKWDELFFLVDIEPNATEEITVSFVEKNSAPKYFIRSNVRFSSMALHKELMKAERLKSTESLTTQKYFQMEGSANKRRADNDEASRIAAKIADGKNIFYADLNDNFLNPDGTIDTSIMPDCLHSSITGNREWAKNLYPVMKRIKEFRNMILKS